MKREVLISVIVPVYNVAKWLERCLLSISGQIYPAFEVILVDDGSTDGSGAICDAWAERDGRFRVLHTDNQGPGQARGAGIRAAGGSFLSFVDADDYISAELLERLYARLLEYPEAAVCYGGYTGVSEGGARISLKAPEQLIYSGADVMRYFAADAIADAPEEPHCCFCGMSVWGNLYRAELFRGEGAVAYELDTEPPGEDLLFNLRVCMAAKQVVVLPERGYYHCLRAGSLSACYSRDNLERAARLRERLLHLLREAGKEYPVLWERIDRNYLDNLILCMRQEAANWADGGGRAARKRLRRMLSAPVTREVLTGFPVGKLVLGQRLLFFLAKWRAVWPVYVLLRLRYGREDRGMSGRDEK